MKSEFEYQYEAGKIRSIDFQIGVRADPSVNNPESFAAILFFVLRDGTVVEVAKVDNAEHEEGAIHVDRYYREMGTDDKDFEVDISGVWEADEYLQSNWKRFARTYLDNHREQQRQG